MVNYATFQEIMNRLGRSSLEMALANLTGNLTVGENALGGTSSASIYIISQSGDEVHYRLENPDSGNDLQYGETVTGQTSSQSGIVMFAESTFINELISKATKEINTYIDYEYGDITLTETEYFSAEDDQETIFLKRDHIISIDSFTFKGTALVEDTDFWVFPESGHIELEKGKLYKYKPKDTEIQYTWGISEVPGGIKLICMDMILNVLEDYFRGKDTGGADSISLAEYSAQYSKRPLITEAIEKRLSKYARSQISAI